MVVRVQAPLASASVPAGFNEPRVDHPNESHGLSDPLKFCTFRTPSQNNFDADLCRLFLVSSASFPFRNEQEF